MNDVMEYKCPNCGGSVKFSSGSQKLVCDYCGTSFEPDVLKQYNEELSNVPADNLKWSELDKGDQWQDANLATMNCTSCGAQIIAAPTTSATACPYCNTPVVITGKLSGALKPDCMIPFKLDKEKAKSALDDHLRGKPLLPSLFKTQNRIDSITGVYVPFWLFDCKAHANIHYRAIKIKTWSDNNFNYTKKDFYSVYREGDLAFERVPVDGSEQMDDALMEAIEPFEYRDSTDFQSAYLLGYMAEKYDVDAAKSKDRANVRIKRSTEKTLGDTVTGYTSVTPENSSVQLSDAVVRYALLPVWMLNTKYKGTMYSFAMNGQTGKFIGNLPVSKAKAFGFFTGIFGGLTGIAAAVIFLLMQNSLENPLAAFGICAAISALIAGIVLGIMWSQMKTAKLQAYAAAYIRQGSFKLTGKKDTFLYSQTEKTQKIQQVQENKRN
ncbi:hypothetical protein FACS1894172_12270 [Spirochaetia bacterium]|nr:hypothetical protein FACS1894164_15840 [Spirochaetia bacterium]GHU33544.1 hypothetical protein FACS1894172_12270 [Spirochaetia bacterium]